MATNYAADGTTGPPVTPGPGTVYPTASTQVYTPAMLSAINQQHNLQAMIELNFIQVGANVMNSALGQLNNALTVTQEALGQLTTLQNLHNQISVSALSAFPFSFTAKSQTLTLPTTMTRLTTNTNQATTFSKTTTFVVNNAQSYQSGYQKLASTYYGKQVTPYFKVSMPAELALNGTVIRPAISAVITSSTQSAYILFRSALLSCRAGISALIASLTPITKPGDSTTLLSQLQTVYENIPSAGAATFSAIKGWTIDNYGGSSGPAVAAAGQFQQNITNAVTSAESLNTSQTESVQNYMFVFEQYCQSAAAVLNALEKIYTSMAQKIAG